MSEVDFFTDDARKAFKAAIEKVESYTSIDVVLVVKKTSDRYRDIDLIGGITLGFLTILLLLFHPVEFAVTAMPFEIAITFALGAYLTSCYWPLKKRLLPAKRLNETVHRAAAAAFVDGGVGRTSARNGILVYISVIERRFEMIADVGIDRSALGAEFESSCAVMAKALENGLDRQSFLESFMAWGPSLGAYMPRQENDVNELSDEVVYS